MILHHKRALWIHYLCFALAFANLLTTRDNRAYSRQVVDCECEKQACVRVEFVPHAADKKFSINCFMEAGNVNWSYSDDYSFTGYGKIPFANLVPATIVDGFRRKVSSTADCAKVFPVSGSTLNLHTDFIDNEIFAISFTTCCDPKDDTPPPTNGKGLIRETTATPIINSTKGLIP